jgi:glycosyltransferase involved in cell wall biosynthesis
VEHSADRAQGKGECGVIAPPIAVLVCTHNRLTTLQECLRRLESQTWKDFSLVVVDDGSSDATPDWMEEYARRTRLRMEYLRQENKGVAAARNRGLERIESRLTLMLGDDVWAADDLVERHLQRHRADGDERMAMLGMTRYVNPGGKVSRFERWMETYGVQFDYGRLERGDAPDWAHFYTSNLSLKTNVLRARFDESFPGSYFEDIEMGYRLSREPGGLRVVYDGKAYAGHFHPMSVRSACSRMYAAGRNAQLLVAKWPELREKFLVQGSETRLRGYRWLARQHGAMDVALTVLDGARDVYLEGAWRRITRLYYFAGQDGLLRP